MKPALILLVAGLLFFASSVYAANFDANPPSDARDVPCIGTPTRKVCIGGTERNMYEVIGQQQEVGRWTDEARDEHVRIFEVNRGAAGCWIRLSRSTSRITSIQCAGMEK
jgi:hypothetical protein